MVMEKLPQQQNESHLVMNKMAQQLAGQQAVQYDHPDRTQAKARKDSHDFWGKRPTFDRGKNQWSDFVETFSQMREHFGVNDDQAKYELFTQAFHNSQLLVANEIYKEATEGFLNKYVRDQMFCSKPESIEAFENKTVTAVQVERRRMKIGDSDSRNMDGLIPVTKAVRDRGELMEVDALNRYGKDELDGDDRDLSECMALQEYELKSPCYYCYRNGHQIRNCPRESVGLPRSSGGRSIDSRGRGLRRGTSAPTRRWNPNYRGNSTARRANQGRRYRVNQLGGHVKDEETAQDNYVEQEDEGNDEEIANFL